MDPERKRDTGEVARRAYALWEKEGRPHGRDRDHWTEAERELGSEPDVAAEADAAETPKKPARTRTKVAAAAATDPVAKPARRRSSKPA